MKQTTTLNRISFFDILEEKLKTEKADLIAHNELKDGLKLVDGKPINKRILSKLPEGSELIVRYGMFHIERNGRSHLIGFDSNPFVNAEKFDDYDSCYCAGSIGRISQIEGFLNNSNKLEQMNEIFSRLADSFKVFTDTVKELENGKFESYYNPVYYDGLRLAGVPPKLVSDVRFDKLKMAD